MDKSKYIIDNETYILAKDKNKNNVTNHQIHDIVFKIILEVDRLCRKHHIPYALGFGSALGLYNYGGFIPWDDDADIVLEYHDYLRLVEVLKNELGEDFTFECYEVDDRCNVLIPPMKIRYKHSYIKERNSFTLPNRTKRGNGVFIDVCPFMGVPENIKEHKKLIRKSKWMMPIYVFLDALLHINPKHMKKSLKRFEKEVVGKYKDSNYVSQTVIIPFQDHPKKYVHSLSFPKDVIYPFKEYEFNGKMLYSFNNVEEFARLRYGDNALKYYDGEKYISRFKHKKESEHLKKVDIFK